MVRLRTNRGFVDVPLQHVSSVQAEIAHLRVVGWPLMAISALLIIGAPFSDWRNAILGVLGVGLGFLLGYGLPTLTVHVTSTRHYVRGAVWHRDELKPFADTLRAHVIAAQRHA